MTVSAIKASKLLARRIKARPLPIVLTGEFPAQEAFILDESRYIDAQCSRRAGKTNGLAIRFFKTMERHPKSQCIYLALTRDSARDIMWPVLHEINDKYNQGCTFLESKLTMIHPNGAKLSLLGADMKNFIKRIKGRKFPGVGVDESQDFGPHLQSLIDDVLTPSISDYADGWLAMTGTPGPVPQGYFFDVTRNKKYGYSHHEWTILENPFMPDPAKFIRELCAKREWPDNHPTLLREYRNKWVLDVQALWIRYSESINHYQMLPNITPHKYNYILGIDIGFNDADAIAVLAWHETLPDIYLVEEIVSKKQGLTELVEQVQAFQAKYNPDKMVIDEGGLGKKLAEEMRRRYSIPVQGADKSRKQENVEMLNDTLRRGRFKAKGNSRFAQDSYLIQIDWDKSTPDKIVIRKKPHSDIIDAVLYGFKESPAFTYQAEKPKVRYGSKEWADAQVDGMFEAEQDGLQSEAQVKEAMGWRE
jgi:terminase large subunit-like protein